jgi:superoxide dismutase
MDSVNYFSNRAMQATWHTRHRTKTNKTNTTQKTKGLSNADFTTKTGNNPDALKNIWNGNRTHNVTGDTH